MGRKLIFKCEVCGKTIEVDEENKDKVPECCGQPMKDITGLPECQSSFTAEQDRSTDEDAPCDNGIG